MDSSNPAAGNEAPGTAFGLPARLGPFLLHEFRGTGSTAMVYRATHADHGEVALKIFHRSMDAELPALSGTAPAAGAASARETAALRRLAHPGIARLLAAGVLESPMGRHSYVAMELIEGVPCRDFAAPLDRSARLEFLAKICDILDYAHRQGVVHRDLKPENIVVRANGQPVVLDFGLARFLEPDVHVSNITTGIGHLVGTVKYMSPEQAQADAARIGPRTDIYSLGVLGYEMLAGAMPYPVSSDNVPGAILTIATVAPRPLGELDPALRGAIEDIFMRALEKRPEWRYPSARAMAADLRRAGAGRPFPPSTSCPARRLPRAAWVRQVTRMRRHPATPWVAAAAAFAAIFATASHLPSLSRPAQPIPHSLAGLYDLLQTADIQRSEADRTPGRFSETFSPETIRGTLALYDQALRLEESLAPHRTRDAEIRFIHWRRAELYYFWGSLQHEPDRLQDASVEFEAARAIPWTKPDHADWIAGPPILRQALQEPPQVFAGGPAIAAAALAAYRDPVANYRRALEWNRESARVFDLWEPVFRGQERFKAEDRAYTVRAVGGALVDLGIATDSLSLIDDGLQLLQSIDPDIILILGPRGSLFQTRGIAWRARAELSRQVADLDSARAALRAALPFRAAGGEQRRTHVELARCAFLESRLARSPQRAEACRKSAQESLLPALASFRYGADPVAEAEIWMLLSAVHVDEARAGLELAAARGDTTRLAAARSALQSARVLLGAAAVELPQHHYPMPYCLLLLQRSALENAAAAADPRGGHSKEAAELLTLASKITAADTPRIRRLLREERLAAVQATGRGATQP